jgi:hypothetical protein
MLGSLADKVLAMLLPKLTGRAPCQPVCFPSSNCCNPDRNCHRNVYSNCHIVCLPGANCT